MSGSLGRMSQLDASTRASLAAGCNFINAEVARVRNRVISAWILAAAAAFIFWAVAARHGMTDPRVPLVAAGALALLFTAHQRRALARTYKAIVVRRIVAALGKGLTYSARSSLRLDEFLGMDLFEKRAERWAAEDEVSGTSGVVCFSIHEAKATRTEGSGKHRRTVTIFRGLVVRLDFNKNFGGHTIVVPDAEGRILGGLFGEEESRRSKSIVRLENADFENLYSVYSTDDQEARYLLTPKMMELVLRARARLDTGLRLCFQRNNLFVAVPSTRDRFEAALFGAKITPESAVGDLADVVSLAEQLVKTLDLETRIWSRV